MTPRPRASIASLIAWVLLSSTAWADSAGTEPHAGVQDAAPAEERPAEDQAVEKQDLARDPSQPDFTLITLPTTLRVPNHRLVFRLTHRFSRPLAQGDFGDLIGDFLGFDSAAQIGLEFRYGLAPGTQIGIHRTNEKTIQFFGQQDLIQQRDGRPISLNAVVTVEGLNNFREQRSAGIGVVVSRRLGDHGAVYAEPIWVSNTSFLPEDQAGDDQTFVMGLGARVRIRPTVYLLGQVIPRLAGHDPGSHHAAFGIEKRVGGHNFQLNVSNSLGTTMAQMARGGSANGTWFIGFNVTRKFF
jgi:hypothetical protein